MVKIKEAILVEGRYDKNTLAQIVQDQHFFPKESSSNEVNHRSRARQHRMH